MTRVNDFSYFLKQVMYILKYILYIETNLATNKEEAKTEKEVMANAY